MGYEQTKWNEGKAKHGGNMSSRLAVIGENGWCSPDNPPSNNRTVQVAWDDMSYGKESFGFYDAKSIEPDSARKYWWSFPAQQGFFLLPDGSVGAWRDVIAQPVEET